MLPDVHLQLLTAAVDGELTPKEAHLLRRVLAESPEAVTLLDQMKSDRECLRNLSIAEPPPDLRERISARLATLPPHRFVIHAVPTELASPAAAPRSWLPLAVAASLLLGISALSFGFFVRTNESNTRSPGRNHMVHGAVIPALPPEDHYPSSPIRIEPPSAVQTRVEVPVPGPAPHLNPPDREFVGPPAPGPNPIFVAPPPSPLAPFTTARVRVPFLTTVMDLDREDVRQQFTEELALEPAWRIDLFTSDAPRGVEQFLTAARANGIAIQVDAFAMDRIRRKLGGTFVIYTEALTSAELRELFGKIAANHARASQPVFDAVHMFPLQGNDMKDLRDLLGFDPGVGKKNVPGPLPRSDANTKPISAETGDQVVRNLTTQSAKPKPIDKPGVLLSFSPRVNPMLSKELLDYRNRRGERKPNAIPVMIVIRTPG